jgi:hypothetical protein
MPERHRTRKERKTDRQNDNIFRAFSSGLFLYTFFIKAFSFSVVPKQTNRSWRRNLYNACFLLLHYDILQFTYVPNNGKKIAVIRKIG